MRACYTTEHNEQAAVIQWARTMTFAFPELRLLFAIPNGAWLAGNDRQRALQVKKLKAEGLKPGVPDLCLPVPRHGFLGCYIEMKKPGGKLRPEQQEWLDALSEQGYLAVACWGVEDAIETLTDYLSSKDLS